jgi:hypothetical protein
MHRDRPSTVILTEDTGGHRSILVRDAAGESSVSETDLIGATAG